MIPEAAVDAAWAQAESDADGYPYPEREEIRRILEAASPHVLAEATGLIRELTDPDDCQFDHHGNCQAHGYSLERGEICPQFKAKVWALGHRPTP